MAKVDVSENMSEETSQIMSRHFNYLKELQKNQKLILAGPCLDRAFGIEIFEAENEEEAEMIMKNDPSVSEGVMEAELHPFRVSLIRNI
ncbi:hypothetical protein BH10BAC5_BH10BAC5_10180 [soil metagenome]